MATSATRLRELLRQLEERTRRAPPPGTVWLDFDVLCGALPLEALPPGEQRDLHMRLRIPRGVTDPVEEHLLKVFGLEAVNQYRRERGRPPYGEDENDEAMVRRKFEALVRQRCGEEGVKELRRLEGSGNTQAEGR
jgi:hypothetical protein